MNTKFSNFTLLHKLLLKSSKHNVQHTNNKTWQYFVELFQEDSTIDKEKFWISSGAFTQTKQI